MHFLCLLFSITIHRLRRTMTSWFLLLGLTLSMILVSVGISFASEYFYAQRSKEEAMPPYGEQFGIYRSGEECFSYDKLRDIFAELKKNTGIIVNNLMVHMDQGEVNTSYPISAEWFAQNDGWHYPLTEGRYFTIKEIEKKEKVVLIGKSLEKFVQKRAKKRYIVIENEEYEVLGLVGLKNQLSLWDNRLFIPFTALPENCVEDLNASTYVNFIVYSIDGGVQKEAEQILEKGKAIFGDMGLDMFGKLETEDVMEDLANSSNQIFVIALLGYVVTLIYAVNIVVLWTEKRRYEIGVRKAFGYSNKAIAHMIFGEMFGISVLSCVLALLTQQVICKFVGKISEYTLQLYWENVVIGLGIVCLTSALISIWPIVRALKVQPVEVLKEGGYDS